MCRVTRKHTWEHRIKSEELRKRLGIHPIEYYIYSRQLCWAGNIARMDLSRLPRRMLSSWIAHSRPQGRPRLTWGATLVKALEEFQLNPEKTGVPWESLAANKCVWKSLLCPNSFYNGVTPSAAAEARARAARPDPTTRTGRTGSSTRTRTGDAPRRRRRNPAEYVEVPCMDIPGTQLVVARAWVRDKQSQHPSVRLDDNGAFSFHILGNPQAQQWFHDAIVAHLQGKPHPALLAPSPNGDETTRTSTRTSAGTSWSPPATIWNGGSFLAVPVS